MASIFIYSFLTFGFVVWFIISGKNKSKWGVNLSRVVCSVCNTKQPIIRMPASKEQAMWGGTTCPQCHTNLDKYGSVIADKPAN